MTKPDGSAEAGRKTVVPGQRGKWSAQERRRIIADSRIAGASVKVVAQRHGVRPNLLSAWRRQDEASRVAKPVKFAALKVTAAPLDSSIEIDLVGGCVRVRGIVDAAMLREVLAAAR